MDQLDSTFKADFKGMSLSHVICLRHTNTAYNTNRDVQIKPTTSLR